MLGRIGVRSCQQEDVVGELGLGGPDLLAVDDPLVAVELGACRERREVAPGIGLGEPLAPRDRAVQDARDELPLLLLGSPLQDGGSDERVPEEVGPQWRLCPGELLVQHDLLEQGQTPAPVLGGPAGADPAAVPQLLDPLLVELLPLFLAHGETGCPPALRQVVLEPCRDDGAELLGFDRVREIHVPNVPTTGSSGTPGHADDGPIWTPALFALRSTGGGGCPVMAGRGTALRA